MKEKLQNLIDSKINVEDMLLQQFLGRQYNDDLRSVNEFEHMITITKQDYRDLLLMRASYGSAEEPDYPRYPDVSFYNIEQLYKALPDYCDDIDLLLNQKVLDILSPEEYTISYLVSGQYDDDKNA